MNDREILEKRLDLFVNESWGLLTEELTTMAESLESIKNIDDSNTLFINKGAVGILDMIINLEQTTKLALDNLD
tara:strand:- start:1272 stop:1493 length:222 start_codon:yes stop_codon:yes gene_type:complete